MTQFIAAYDVENAELCPKALERLVEVHEEAGVPATFFIVGRLLEQKRSELRRLLDRPWADLQSHTWSHKLLRDSLMHGPGVPPAEAKEEIVRGKRSVEDAFGRRCTGLRSGCGFNGGLKGRPDLLEIAVGCGLSFISTDLRGPGDSIPAPLKEPYRYVEDGFPGLWELPGHGWHDNVLKLGDGKMLTIAWPPLEPWFIPPAPPKTPREEAAIYRVWLDQGVARGLPYVSLVWHPWSHYRFAPGGETVRWTLEYVSSRGLETTTYGAWAAAHAA